MHGCQRHKLMSEQIEGQMNIFDFLDEPKQQKYICDSCLWNEEGKSCFRQSVWKLNKTFCPLAITEAEGWHRIKNYTDGHVSGSWPENTDYQRPVLCICKNKETGFFKVSATGKHGAFTFKKDTMKQHYDTIEAWIYEEDF